MIRATAIAAAAALTLTACTTTPTSDGSDPNERAKRGALIGAGLGAAVGVITGDNAEERRNNALKGAIIGGGAGAIVGNQLDRQEADLRRDLNNSDVQITNTGDRLIVTMPNSILFATGSSNVRSDLVTDLRNVAGNLQAYPNSTIQVVGHTDSDGDAAFNQNLSNQRAQAVAGVLISSGSARTVSRRLGGAKTSLSRPT